MRNEELICFSYECNVLKVSGPPIRRTTKKMMKKKQHTHQKRRRPTITTTTSNTFHTKLPAHSPSINFNLSLSLLLQTKMKPPADATNDNDWATVAMAHDSLVVDLLLRLKHQASPPWPGKLVSHLAPASWGAKQPRSGSKSVFTECRRKSKERIGRRCSPSTPLSWSGGSGGCAVDGCETSSLPPSSRSKISLAGNQVNGASSSKPRKKKTYAELKDEEDFLLKERMHLHHQLAMLGATVKEQRDENESLKRIKLNLSTQLLKNSAYTVADIGEPNVPSSMKAVMRAEGHDCVSTALISSASCKAEHAVIPAQKGVHLMLPDLNMMPPELDSTN